MKMNDKILYYASQIAYFQSSTDFDTNRQEIIYNINIYNNVKR